MRWKNALILILIPLCAACGMKEAQVKKEKEASAHYKLGVSYLNDTLLQKAFIEFQKAVEIDSGHRDAQYALGHVHFLQEDYNEAIASFKKTLSIDPKFSDAHNYLGKTYEAQGKLDQAVSEYQEALKNPQYDTPEKPNLNLGMVYIKQGKYDQAIRSLQTAVRLTPPGSPALIAVSQNELGKAYLQTGKFKESIASYQEAIRLVPNYLDAHLNLASAYLKEGSKGLAAGAFKKVVDLSPKSPQAKEAQKFLDALR
ncbi:MAG: tetratricopeptide repeat protein [Nitrospirae bacterium]|nr:tetratricopeptide repeat protein [Candidatus Manganitrophaceae bacterium]